MVHGGNTHGRTAGGARSLDIDHFAAQLEHMMDSVPERLWTELNGGVSVSEQTHRRRDDPDGVYILGEYITDPYLGAMIVLYYGSFDRLFRGQPDEVWARELWDTLRHELRHHVEGRAGVSDLDVEDAVELARLRDAPRAAARYRVRGALPRPKPHG